MTFIFRLCGLERQPMRDLTFQDISISIQWRLVSSRAHFSKFKSSLSIKIYTCPPVPTICFTPPFSKNLIFSLLFSMSTTWPFSPSPIRRGDLLYFGTRFQGFYWIGFVISDRTVHLMSLKSVHKAVYDVRWYFILLPRVWLSPHIIYKAVCVPWPVTLYCWLGQVWKILTIRIRQFIWMIAKLIRV